MRLTTAVAAATLAMCASANAQTYHVVDLGTLGGLGGAECFALRGTGALPIAAGFATSSNQNFVGFASQGGGMTAIPPLSGNTQSCGFGVDGLGRVIGVSYQLGEPGVQAVRVDGATVTSLGGFAARGVNAAGDIVGSLTTTDAGTGLQVEHACIMPVGAAAPADLGTLFGALNSFGYGINSLGMVVGMTGGTSNIGSRAALWWQGMKIDLGTIGGNDSAAYAINDSRVAVGWSAPAGATPEARAVKFVLDSTGLVQSRVNLGALPSPVAGGPTWSYAYGINNAGLIVGQSTGRAFVHDANGMHELNQLVPASGGWWIVNARAIDDGGRIAASGVDALGRPRPLLLVPCDADTDRSGTVTIDDLFLYFDHWFRGLISADTDRTGIVTVDDLFLFLNGWFAGCPV